MAWVKLISVNPDLSLVYNKDHLAEMLIGFERVAICSVIGEQGSGKTFLINHLMAELLDQEEEQVNASAGESVLESSASSSEKCIWICQRPIKCSIRGIAIQMIFLDTFGLDGFGGTEKLNSFIVSLAGAVSSVLLYNVERNISTRVFDILSDSLFDYASLVVISKPRFVVRDCKTTEEETNECLDRATRMLNESTETSWGKLNTLFGIPTTLIPISVVCGQECPGLVSSVSRLAKDVRGDIDNPSRLRSADMIKFIFENAVKEFDPKGKLGKRDSTAMSKVSILNRIFSLKNSLPNQIF